MFVGGCNSIGNWFEGLLPIYAIDHLSRKPVPTFRNDLARYRAFESGEGGVCVLKLTSVNALCCCYWEILSIVS